MQKDDETTACQIHVHGFLKELGNDTNILITGTFDYLPCIGYNISLHTVLRARTLLGWVFRGSAYCQTIREANKAKRLAWCQAHQIDDFQDVISMDESSI